MTVMFSVLVRSICVSAFCFFFQAEDGIRDTSVTGVQTCALPIFRRPRGKRFLRFFSSGMRAEISAWLYCNTIRTGEIGRASCRGKSVERGGGRVSERKRREMEGGAVGRSLSM